MIQSIISSTSAYASTFGTVTDLTAADTPGQWVYSQIVSTSGFGEGDLVIAVVSGQGEYKVNAGDWTALPGTFNNGDFLFARTLVPTRADVQRTTVYLIDDTNDTFVVTTGAGVAGSFENYTDSENYTDGENYVD